MSTTGSWQYLSVAGQAPSGTSYACVLVYSNTSNTGTAYFDKTTIAELGLSVQNSSFENADGNGLPVDWSYLGDNPGFISGSTTRAYDSSRSLKVYDTSASQDVLARSYHITVTAGKSYIARVYCYLESGADYLYLEYFNSSGTRIGEFHKGLSATGSWRQISVTGQAPDGTSYACVSVYSNTSNTGTAYFDMATISEKIYARGLTVENGGFEALGANGLPAYWQFSGSGYESSTARSAGGSRSLKLSDTSTVQDAYATSPEIKIIENKNYIARAKCYVESGTAYLCLAFEDSEGTRIQETHSALSTAGSWQPMSITGIAPIGASYATVSVYSSTDAHGYSLF